MIEPQAESGSIVREAGAPEERARAAAASYSIEPVRPGDEEEILRLLRATVGETEASRKSPDFWRWKHLEGPFGPSYSLCSRSEDAELAGFRTVMRWKLSGGAGRTVKAARPVDTATHPDHRRRGIFRALTESAIAGLEEDGTVLVFNTPNANSLRGYLKMGWEQVDRFPLYVKPIRWRNVGKHILSSVTSTGHTPSGPPPTDERPNQGYPTWARLREQGSDALHAFIEESEARRNDTLLRTERSIEYLDWRYGRHPDIKYHAYPVEGPRGLESLVIGRKVSGVAGLRALAVTELFLRAPSPQAGARALTRAGRESQCDYILAYFARGTTEHEGLRRARFVRAPGRGYTLVTRALRPVIPDPSHASSWDLTLGELEIF